MQANTPTAATTARPTAPRAATVRRGCHRISPYRAGYEDARYDLEYRNPFAPDSLEWRLYEQGSQDARQGAGR